MDNLLLWASCPTNEQGIYPKAIFTLYLSKRAALFSMLYWIPTDMTPLLML